MGKVVSLWRYPVKSMLGEELNSSKVTERGLQGDRSYALVDPQTTKVASAKNPRKWGKLFDFRSQLIDNPGGSLGNLSDVRITLPDGETVLASYGTKAEKAISDAIGAEVELQRSSDEAAPVYEEYWPNVDGLPKRDVVTEEAMPSRTFFDLATIHLLTTATLDRLGSFYPKGRFEARRFRPNIIIKPLPPADEGYVENDWINRNLLIGEEVRLNVTGPCLRCVMTTLPQGDLPSDLGILRTVAQNNQIRVGVYASVVRGGEVKREDLVRIE